MIGLLAKETRLVLVFFPLNHDMTFGGEREFKKKNVSIKNYHRFNPPGCSFAGHAAVVAPAAATRFQPVLVGPRSWLCNASGTVTTFTPWGYHLVIAYMGEEMDGKNTHMYKYMLICVYKYKGYA